MKILIETYRKWDIFFDTDKEEFYTVSNEYDKDFTKKSFAASKKYIDDYIKENLNFKPVLVQNEPSWYDNAKTLTLIGLRKDGAFMSESKDGVKSQFSKYDEDKYFLVNSDNDHIFKQIDELNIRRNEIENQIRDLKKSLIKVTVTEYRKSLEI